MISQRVLKAFDELRFPRVPSDYAKSYAVEAALAKVVDACEFVADEENYFGTDTKDPHTVRQLQNKLKHALAELEQALKGCGVE